MAGKHATRGMGWVAFVPACLIMLLAPVAGWGCWAVANPTALHVSTPGPYENAHTTSTITANFGRQGLRIDFYVSSEQNLSPGSVNPTSAITGPGGGVTTTYTSGDDVGPICITARDHNDPDTGASCWVTVLKVQQQQALWWFDGIAPECSYPYVYYTSVLLLAEGAEAGSYYWDIQQGFDKAGFQYLGIWAQSLQTSSSAVTLYSRSASTAIGDVKVATWYGGDSLVTYRTESHSPTSVVQTYSAPPDAPYGTGFLTVIHYYPILDNFAEELPYPIWANEEFVGPEQHYYPNEDWGHTPNAHFTGAIMPDGSPAPSYFQDHIGGAGPYTPPPQNPPVPWSEPGLEGDDKKVDGIDQHFHVGSSLSGYGSLVQCGFMERWVDHARVWAAH